MSSLEEMVQKLVAAESLNKSPDYVKDFPKAVALSEDTEFQEAYVNKLIKEQGLVYCCTCQKFIDDEAHNIAHVFARNTTEIREKSIIEKMMGKTSG